MTTLNEHFLWGNSTSSMQTEGAWNLDGKGPSVYDITPAGPHNADWQVAIDDYHRYLSRGAIFRRPIFKIIRRDLPLSRRIILRFDDLSIPILQYIPATVSFHRNRPTDADLLTALC